MTHPAPEVSDSAYRIGAVARWSGISAETLRVWERRYKVVNPRRSDGGDRLYSADDLARLILIKRLVDNGDSIGNLARLDREELEQRLRLSDPIQPLAQDRPLSVIVVGGQLAMELENAAAPVSFIELRTVYTSLSEFEKREAPHPFDVLVLEVPTLHEDTAQRLSELAHGSGARHTLVVYRYASRFALSRLPLANISTMRGPVDLNDLKRRLQEIMNRSPHASPSASPSPQPAAVAPHPLFDTAQLATLNRMKLPVQCECPRHLAELVNSLGAFEHYSAECQNRNADDAALHAYLHEVSGQARHLIELALQRVIQTEGIEL